MSHPIPRFKPEDFPILIVPQGYDFLDPTVPVAHSVEDIEEKIEGAQKQSFNGRDVHFISRPNDKHLGRVAYLPPIFSV
jgi:hypothetical protein